MAKKKISRRQLLHSTASTIASGAFASVALDEAAFTVGAPEIPDTGLDAWALLAAASTMLLLGTALLTCAHRPTRS